VISRQVAKRVCASWWGIVTLRVLGVAAAPAGVLSRRAPVVTRRPAGDFAPLSKPRRQELVVREPGQEVAARADVVRDGAERSEELLGVPACSRNATVTPF
jgi:hypothetical protein